MRAFRSLSMWVFLTVFASVVVPRWVSAQTPVQLKTGDPAPSFSLQGSDGRIYSLADFRGKQAVILVWFVKAFSGG
jgi:hypothetical protein